MCIPKNWSEVTLESFYGFSKTLNEIPQDDLEGYDLRIKRACLLSNSEVEDVLQMKDEDLDGVETLMAKPLPTKLKKRFKFNGQRYKVLRNIKKGESWRYQGIMNECRDEKGDNLHRIMFYCCQPVNRWGRPIELKPYEMGDRIEEFKKLSIALVNPIVVFFYTLSNKLTELTLQYTEDQMKTMTKKMKREIDYLKSMDGSL